MSELRQAVGFAHPAIFDPDSQGNLRIAPDAVVARDHHLAKLGYTQRVVVSECPPGYVAVVMPEEVARRLANREGYPDDLLTAEAACAASLRGGGAGDNGMTAPSAEEARAALSAEEGHEIRVVRRPLPSFSKAVPADPRVGATRISPR